MFKSKEQFKRSFVQIFKQMHGQEIEGAAAGSGYRTL